jgi:hypothetical protein
MGQTPFLTDPNVVRNAAGDRGARRPATASDGKDRQNNNGRIWFGGTLRERGRESFSGHDEKDSDTPMVASHEFLSSEIRILTNSATE